MANPNDILVIEQIFAKRKSQFAPSASEAAFWEFFTAEQILRDYSFDLTDIKFGIVGQESNKGIKGLDGGIDSIYLIANGRLIRDVEDARAMSGHKGHVQFDIVIIQSKCHAGFDIATLTNLKQTSERIFNLTLEPSAFPVQYNSLLLNVIECFREAHKALLLCNRTISVCYYIATKGDKSQNDGNVNGQAEELENAVKNQLATITSCSVHFYGARDLIELFNKPRPTKTILHCLNSLLTDGKGGFSVLVTLRDYYAFIAESCQIKEYLFESNVRDYEGEVPINRQIKDTIKNPQNDINFWWLNNGITIIAEHVGGQVPDLELENPQIVNGLQTSQVIFESLIQPDLGEDSAVPKHVLVRIIESRNPDVQDKIIRATNSQTRIPAQYLWAFESHQRDIAILFEQHGLFYERKKNSWRQSDKRFEFIVTPTELQQNVAAVLLQEPDHARGRPGRYSKPQYRKRIYNPRTNINVYVVCSLLRRRVESYLEQKESDPDHRRNLLFYVMMAMRPSLLVDDNGKRVFLHHVKISTFEIRHSMMLWRLFALFTRNAVEMIMPRRARK